MTGEIFPKIKNKSRRTLQRIVDSAWTFKVRTLLAGTTINNWQSKYDQHRKEKEASPANRDKIRVLEL